MLQDDLLIVMRVYFEKPRTTVGWLHQRPAPGRQLCHQRGLKWRASCCSTCWRSACRWAPI
jgi:3-deoxy-D-arabino-heptulosonate 7-phosphate (DAHP) synthase